jgi:hypothetical protein
MFHIALSIAVLILVLAGVVSYHRKARQRDRMRAEFKRWR